MVGIVVGAIVGVFTLVKLLRELAEPLLLTSRMKKARELADKATGAGAKSVLSAEAATLSSKIAARRSVRYSRRDKASGLLFLVSFSLLVALPAVGAETTHTGVRIAAWIFAFALYQVAMLRFLPRAQTIRFRRQLLVELGMPREPVKALAIPSARDYLLRTTITPGLVMQIATRAFPDARSSDDLVAAVNLTIEILEEATYRNRPQRGSNPGFESYAQSEGESDVPEPR